MAGQSKFAFCIGTRPEAIKLAPLILKAREIGIETLTIASGQHVEMLHPILDYFKISPQVILELERKSHTLSELTSLLIQKLGQTFVREKPSLVIVQGDTTTALTGALSAFYEKIPVAHVEAGLRTNDRYSPFPEEMNRKLIASLAQFHFAPTEASAKNLKKENVEGAIEVTGNTGIDALRLVCDGFKAAERTSQKLILVTCHRRENHGNPLLEVCAALKEIAISHPDYQIVFPVHLNPNVQTLVHQELASVPNIKLLPPLGYFEFAKYINDATLILTDSGGIQEEAPYLKKPVLVLRDSTERPEGIEAGVAILVGSDSKKIVSTVRRLLQDQAFADSFKKSVNPYGDGYSSERILTHLRKLGY